jgi:hypothetical protein
MMDLRQEWQKEGLESEVRRVETRHWPVLTSRWYVGLMFLALSISQLTRWGGLLFAAFVMILAVLDVLGHPLKALKQRFVMKATQVTWGWKDSERKQAPVLVVSASYNTPAGDGFERRHDRLSRWPLGFFLNPTRLWLLWLLVGALVLCWSVLQPSTASFWSLLGINLLFGLSFWKWGGASAHKDDGGEHAAAVVALREVATRSLERKWPFHLHFVAMGASDSPEGVELSLKEWNNKGRILGWVHLDELYAGQPLQTVTKEGCLLLQPHASELVEQAQWTANHLEGIRSTSRYGRSPSAWAAILGQPALMLTSVPPHSSSDSPPSVSFEQVDRAAGFVTTLLHRLAREEESL